MKTCIICHVTQAIECFEATRNQCKVCYNTRTLQRYYRMRRTIDGRLRQLYQGCKERHKLHRGELITFERFDAIFHAQDGVCVETGIPFDLQSKDLMPSPDRIDNDAGYIDGNVRFTTWRINNMRKNMSTARFHSTCMEVVEPNACVLVVMPDNMARVKTEIPLPASGPGRASSSFTALLSFLFCHLLCHLTSVPVEVSHGQGYVLD